MSDFLGTIWAQSEAFWDTGNARIKNTLKLVIVSTNNIFGCQFHPEKSAKDGLVILKNFCEI